MSGDGRSVVHVVVHGRVQGVGYRSFVQHEAARHSVEGWVRNCRDGTVEVLFKGDADQIADMLAALKRGPHAARVDAVLQRPGTDADLRARVPGEAFSQLPTF